MLEQCHPEPVEGCAKGTCMQLMLEQCHSEPHFVTLSLSKGAQGTCVQYAGTMSP